MVKEITKAGNKETGPGIHRMDPDTVPFLWEFYEMDQPDERPAPQELYHIYTGRSCVYGTVKKYLFLKEYAADGRMF